MDRSKQRGLAQATARPSQGSICRRSVEITLAGGGSTTATGDPAPPSERVIVLVPALAVELTLVLGGTTYLAFYLVGGSLAVSGPAVLWESWWFLCARGHARRGSRLRHGAPARVSSGLAKVVLIVLAAWLGEYLVPAFGPVDNDLNPQNALYYWTLATAGPLQPDCRRGRRLDA